MPAHGRLWGRRDDILSSYTWENWGQLEVTQRNHSEVSLESSPLGFNYPPTQSPSPDVPGSCFPQAVCLPRKLAVHPTWKVSLAEKVVCEKPLPLGQASRVSLWAAWVSSTERLPQYLHYSHSTACRWPKHKVHLHSCTTGSWSSVQSHCGPLRANCFRCSGSWRRGLCTHFQFCIRE